MQEMALVHQPMLVPYAKNALGRGILNCRNVGFRSGREGNRHFDDAVVGLSMLFESTEKDGLVLRARKKAAIQDSVTMGL
jgi:hypothetical protein